MENSNSSDLAEKERAIELEELGEEPQHQDEDTSKNFLSDISSDNESEHDQVGKLELEPAMMNELFLVCSNLGIVQEFDDDRPATFVRGEDCIEWIHDLQRAIRRDQAKSKAIAITLGRWQILQKKLIPLMMNHQDDWNLVFSLLKVVVMLTMKPLKDSSNLAIQFHHLRAYKRAFVRPELIHFLVSLLADPLAREGRDRSGQDYLVMELVLTLFRNLLAIPNETPRQVSSSNIALAHLQEDLVFVFHEQHVYEMIVLFAQDVESAEVKDWNLLLMEILELTFRYTTPEELITVYKQEQGIPGATPQMNLAQKLKTEAAKKQTVVSGLAKSSRHSNFGGVLQIQTYGNRRAVLTNMTKTADEHVPVLEKKRKIRKKKMAGAQLNDVTDPFGASVHNNARGHGSDQKSPHTHAINVALSNLCVNLIDKCYFQLMNSLKGEFRRGAGKLLPTDRTQYFQLTWFLLQFDRLRQYAIAKQHKARQKEYKATKKRLFDQMQIEEAMQLPEPPKYPGYQNKNVLVTFDMFSFNFVLQSIEYYIEMKNHTALVTGVHLLCEMMFTLGEMRTSADPRYQQIADSLQMRLFYEREFLDRFPALLRSWSPRAFPLTYAIDLVTLTHVLLKMLDKGNIVVLSKRKTTTTKGPGSDSETDEETRAEKRVALEQQRKEHSLNVRKYLFSIIRPDTIKLYAYVLSHYKINSVMVNHYVHAFLYRVQQFPVELPEEHQWQGQIPTLEPLLYQLEFLNLFDRILQDPELHHEKAFAPLRKFLKGIVAHFFALAAENHLMFVEILFKHSYALKHCALMQMEYRMFGDVPQTVEQMEDAAREEQEQKQALQEEAQKRHEYEQMEIEGETEFDFGAIPKTQNDGEIRLQHENVPLKPKRKKTFTKRWTSEEDAFLKEKYLEFRELPSVFKVLSVDQMLKKNRRTPEQVRRRVKHLKLDISGSEKEEEEVEGGPTPKKRRRLQRRFKKHTSIWSDESESDADLPQMTSMSQSMAIGDKGLFSDVSDAEEKQTKNSEKIVASDSDEDNSSDDQMEKLEVETSQTLTSAPVDNSSTQDISTESIPTAANEKQQQQKNIADSISEKDTQELEEEAETRIPVALRDTAGTLSDPEKSSEIRTREKDDHAPEKEANDCALVEERSHEEKVDEELGDCKNSMRIDENCSMTT